MKKAIKKLINMPSINGMLRWLITLLTNLNRNIISKAKQYIQFSGVLNIYIEDIKFKLVAKSDDHFVTKAYYEGLMEKNEAILFKHLSKHAKIIFDIGSNVGLYSIVASKTNPTSSIYAFDPDRFVFNRLVDNISINHLNNITTTNCAIGSNLSQVELYTLESEVNTTTSSLYKNQAQHFYSNEKLKKNIVEQTTIDQLVFKKPGVKPDLIKIDVELNELNVLKGAERTLKELKPIILIEIFNNEIKSQIDDGLAFEFESDYTHQIENILKTHGYQFYVIGHSGILKVNDFRSNPDISNYLVSKNKAKKLFYCWRDVNEFASEIYINN
jgi:FkbM family methyltransferase